MPMDAVTLADGSGHGKIVQTKCLPTDGDVRDALFLWFQCIRFVSKQSSWCSFLAVTMFSFHFETIFFNEYILIGP